MRAFVVAAAAVGVVSGGLALVGSGSALAAGPKYYFQLHEVKAGPDIDPALKAYAGEALNAELASRPEWASDVGAQGDALVAALNRRKLRGFDVTVRIESLKKEVKDPSPGARHKRLGVGVRLTVFGTTIPEEKLAFSGDGEAGLESEVPEKRMEAEGTSLARDAIKDAVKQAVDQAVMKLAIGKSAPLNESKRKKKK
jgi:hypothetical protein